RVRGADDELVQAARARLRGAGEPRLLAAEPVGVCADPALLEEPQGQASRVPLSRPVVQPVPRLLGDADGGPRRHQQPHRAAGSLFTPDLIETWLSYKRVHEIDEVRLRPHPWEFYLYYDI